VNCVDLDTFSSDLALKINLFIYFTGLVCSLQPALKIVHSNDVRHKVLRQDINSINMMYF
jgi:hypothetical protein